MVLLIGRTGNGKSTIGNVLCGENRFKESELGVAETKEFQSENVEVNGLKLRIIDTIGIGDTKLSAQEVLLKIADAAYSLRTGIHQVIFVTSGKFTEEEITAYDILRSVIFNNEIVHYTTIVRTRFPSFRNVEKCEDDILRMKSENDKLSSLLSTCKKIMHVNNLTEEEEPGLKSRADSRTRLLLHLSSCRQVYNPAELGQLNDRITGYMTEKQLLERLLSEINIKLAESDNLNRDLRARLELERTEQTARYEALKAAVSKETGMQIKEKALHAFEFIGGNFIKRAVREVNKCSIQ